MKVAIYAGNCYCKHFYTDIDILIYLTAVGLTPNGSSTHIYTQTNT